MKWHNGHHQNEARPMVVKGGETNSSVVPSPIQSYKCYILWYYVLWQHIADLNVDVNMLESKILTQRALFTVQYSSPALLHEGIENMGCFWYLLGGNWYYKASIYIRTNVKINISIESTFQCSTCYVCCKWAGCLEIRRQKWLPTVDDLLPLSGDKNENFYSGNIKMKAVSFYIKHNERAWCWHMCT